jgi:hypothetical protein
LGDVQARGCAGQMLFLRDRDEVGKLGDAHGRTAYHFADAPQIPKEYWSRCPFPGHTGS